MSTPSHDTQSGLLAGLTGLLALGLKPRVFSIRQAVDLVNKAYRAINQFHRSK